MSLKETFCVRQFLLMLKTDLEKITKKEIIQKINCLYSLDRITIQKIQVNTSFVKRKNIRLGAIFDRPDTLTIFRFQFFGFIRVYHLLSWTSFSL